MENDSALTVEGLTKYYNSFLAVDHIHFDVKKGEIFGFLGPNGASRSRLLWFMSHRSSSWMSRQAALMW